jgi:hypothetical protein
VCVFACVCSTAGRKVHATAVVVVVVVVVVVDVDVVVVVVVGGSVSVVEGRGSVPLLACADNSPSLNTCACSLSTSPPSAHLSLPPAVSQSAPSPTLTGAALAGVGGWVWVSGCEPPPDPYLLRALARRGSSKAALRPLREAAPCAGPSAGPGRGAPLQAHKRACACGVWHALWCALVCCGVRVCVRD